MKKFFQITLFFLLFTGLSYCKKDTDKDKQEQLLLASLLVLSQQPGIPISEGSITTADNVRLYYKTVGAGKPVMVLHGGAGLDHNYLLPHLQNLLAADHQLIFYDQRGTGKSELPSDPTPDLISVDKFISDLEDIRKHLNLDKLNLMGHSWGAHLALQYTIRPEHSSKVKSLLLISSMGANYNYYNVLLANLLGKNIDVLEYVKLQTELRIQKTPSAAKAYYGYVFGFYFQDPKNISKLNLEFSQNTAKNTLEISDSINLSLPLTFSGQEATGSFDLNLSSINVPVLIVHGQNDVIPIQFALKASESNSIINKLSGTFPQTVPISNCGHFPFIEQPTVFAGAVRNFLQNID